MEDMTTRMSQDSRMRLEQKVKALGQLEALGSTWISPDLSIEKTTIINPGPVKYGVNVVISKKDLTPIDINQHSLEMLKVSVRSFLAQSGLNIGFPLMASVTDKIIKDLNDGKNVPIPTIMSNFGGRPIELDGRVMRLFWVDGSKRLTGRDLREVMKTGFTVEGEEGVDWSFIDAYSADGPTLGEKHLGQVDPVCVQLHLRKKKFYIPDSDEPLRIKGKPELAAVLQEVPEGMRLPFRIGETAKVKLADDIVGVIDLGHYENESRHIASPLIDPGFEGVIRTEIFEPVGDQEYIQVYLYRK